MTYAMELTREEKAEVFALARQLGMSATALYREYATAPAERVRPTIREAMEAETITATRAAYREVSAEVTERCRVALTASRATKEHALGMLILRALPGKGVMVTSGDAREVQVHAVTDRRGTLEHVGTVTVIRNRAGMYKWAAVGEQPERVTESALLDVLADLLPARIDSVPARFRETLRAKRYRERKDVTGEAATPGMADGAEFSTVARPARRGTRGLSDAHKREITRQRVERHRAKVRAARIAAEGREHALRPAEVQTVGEAALTPAKPLPAVADTNDKTAVLAELETLRMEREAWKAREAARATVPAPAPVAAVPAPVTAPEPEAEAEPLTLF